MNQLSSQAMERARNFVRTSARPLDQARFAYYFDGGPADEVYRQLARLQNADGGFGHGLEPDIQTPTSTVIATTVGLQHLRDLGASPDHSLVANAMRYLMAAYDDRAETWPLIDATSQDAPHAPWWTYDENFASGFGNFLTNPRAEIVGYMYDYPDLAPEDLRRRLTDAIVAQLQAAAPEQIAMFDLHCYIRLAETPSLPEHMRGTLVSKLRPAVDHCVERNVAAWEEYVLTPLAVVESPHSPFAEQLADIIPANLDWLIAKQGADGAWGPAWSWGNMFPDAWIEAERDWKGVITVDTLRRLKAFGRLG